MLSLFVLTFWKWNFQYLFDAVWHAKQLLPICTEYMTRKQSTPLLRGSCKSWMRSTRLGSDTKKGAFFNNGIVVSAFVWFTKARIAILYPVHNISFSLAGTGCCIQFWMLVVLMLSSHYRVRLELACLGCSLIDSFRNIRLGLRVYRCENQAKMVSRWSLYGVPQSH